MVTMAGYRVVSLDVVPVGCSAEVGVLPGVVEPSGVGVVDELDDVMLSISTYLFQWAMRSCNERAHFTHVY